MDDLGRLEMEKRPFHTPYDYYRKLWFMQSTTGEIVVLVHGIGSSRLIMWPLASRMRRAGFRVVQWSYPTWFTPIGTHAERLAEFITKLQQEYRVHLVAHSMGTIISRAALTSLIPTEKTGRFVQLAPPNHGSPVARLVGKVFGSVLKPTRELSDEASSYVNKLPNLTVLKKAPYPVESGIIAARYDHLVPLKSTYLAGADQHVTLAATHNSLLFSSTASKLVIEFLRNGSFGV